jgi:20S proteasome subunit beta 1
LANDHLINFFTLSIFQRQTNVAIGGSGSTYIYGLVDHQFKEGMTKDEAKALVEKSISHAMARDGSSGGVIRTVIITEGGCDKEFIPGDKLPFGP